MIHSHININIKMKLYVAGGWKFRDEIAVVKTQFETYGYTITSNWIDRENGLFTPENFENDANMDIKEVTEADVLVAVMTDPEYAYRGTCTEIGCALGQNKPVVIICPGTSKKISDTKWEFSHYCQRNVFFWHKNITHVLNVDDAVAHLNKIDV
jgi:nucleoside 2-deoxyribosyltransferase